MPEITKRRVTLRNTETVSVRDEQGNLRLMEKTFEVNDYVRPDLLEAYVIDAQRRWQSVTVSDEPDAGPAGYDGPTYVPFGVQVPVRDPHTDEIVDFEFHEFPHELAGSYFPATDCVDCDHAPVHPVTGRKARTVREEI